MKLDEDPKIIDQTGAAEVCGDEYNEVRVFFRRRAQRRRISDSEIVKLKTGFLKLLFARLS